MSVKVSIIMPVYNAELYIRYAIESVLKQSYTNWELLIIDDCSMDASANIVKEYLADKKIRYMRLNKNQGVANARNTGIEQSKGEYIAFLDADDYWDPVKLDMQLKFMFENASDFSCTELVMVDHEGKYIKTIKNYRNVIQYKTLLYDNQIACSSVIISKALLRDRRFMQIRHEDLALWLHITKEEEALCLKEPLLHYRKIENSLSSNKMKSAKWRWQIYRNIEHMPFYRCVYYFIVYAMKGVIKHHS